MDLNLDLTLSSLYYQQLPREENQEHTNPQPMPEILNTQENPENPNLEENQECPNLLENLEKQILPENSQNPNPEVTLHYNVALYLYNDPFDIKKILTRSDLTHGFCIRSQWWASIFPYLQPHVASTLLAFKCISMTIKDIDTDTNHEVLLRAWTGYQRFAIAGGWFEEFVQRRILKIGDEIGFLWDRHDQKLLFTVLKRREAGPY